MPVRSNVQDESRYLGRILPKSRIRMEELLPEAIASGTYDAELELVSDSKTMVKRNLTLKVDAEDFPAQEVLIAQVANSLQVSPAQIELSQIRGGNRRLSILFKNTGKEELEVKLRGIQKDDRVFENLLLQPEEFRLPMNGTRKIAVTMKGQTNPQTIIEFGSLVVETKSTRRDYAEKRELPLVMQYKKQPNANITMSPLVWDPAGKYPCFRSVIENRGESFMPIDARLTATHESGQRLQVAAGFGKWLMPGEKITIHFRIDQPLANGDYKLTTELRTGAEPAVMEQTYSVNDLSTATTSR